MITDKEIFDKIHVNLHAVRLLPKYVGSEFEKRISALLVEKYADTCDECREVRDKNKLNPNAHQNKNFFDKLGDLMR